MSSAMENHFEEETLELEALHVRGTESEAESSNEFVESSLPSLDEVEDILGYKFRNKSLLVEAFTHVTFSPENSSFNYERLEYLGDSILNLLIAKEQYFLYPDLSPGLLTELRAANVDSEKLARVAIKHGFHRFLRHKKPDLEELIEEFCKGIKDYPLRSNGLIVVPKDLADIVEATIAAVFIDSNSSMDTVWKIFKQLLEPIIVPETLTTHPKTTLYQICQKRNLKLKFVDMWEEHMSFNVFIDEKLVGSGRHGLKKEIAQNRAADDALNNIETILGENYNALYNHIASTDST